MARQPEEAPGEFALRVAAEIRREMGDRRISGRGLASILEKSEKYARERIAERFAFSLNDIETFCTHVGIAPEDFIARVESEPVARVTEGQFGRPDVSALSEDELMQLPHAANRDDSAGDEEPDTP